MATTSCTFKHALGIVVLDIDWSGSSVCGRGPNDEVPDINDVKGWIEDEHGKFIRDLTKDELEAMNNDDTIQGYVFEAIHEAYNEPSEPDYDPR